MPLLGAQTLRRGEDTDFRLWPETSNRVGVRKKNCSIGRCSPWGSVRWHFYRIRWKCLDGKWRSSSSSRKHYRGRPTEHLCTRTKYNFIEFCSSKSMAIGNRKHRDRCLSNWLQRVSRLKKKHNWGSTISAKSGHGKTVCAAYPPDAVNQGSNRQESSRVGSFKSPIFQPYLLQWYFSAMWDLSSLPFTTERVFWGRNYWSFDQKIRRIYLIFWVGFPNIRVISKFVVVFSICSTYQSGRDLL